MSPEENSPETGAGLPGRREFLARSLAAVLAFHPSLARLFADDGADHRVSEGCPWPVQFFGHVAVLLSRKAGAHDPEGETGRRTVSADRSEAAPAGRSGPDVSVVWASSRACPSRASTREVLEHPLHFGVGTVIILLLLTTYGISRSIKGPDSPLRNPHVAVRVAILCLYVIQTFFGLSILL